MSTRPGDDPIVAGRDNPQALQHCPPGLRPRRVWGDPGRRSHPFQASSPALLAPRFGARRKVHSGVCPSPRGITASRARESRFCARNLDDIQILMQAFRLRGDSPRAV